jgi:hypothetical protein
VYNINFSLCNRRRTSQQFEKGNVLAIHIACGTPEPNEVDAIRTLSDQLFGDEWALLTNIPRTVVPMEIDGCLLGPKGMIILEMKNHPGVISCHGIGFWDGIPKAEGNPLEQAEDCAQKLKGWLIGRDPSLDGEVYIDSIVVMTHPKCQLTEIGQEIVDRVGSLRDTPVLIGRRLRDGLDAGIPERIFKLITGQDPPPDLIARWQTAKRIIRRKAPIAKEKQSGSKTVDRLRRIQALATELERTDPFLGRTNDVSTLTERHNRLFSSSCSTQGIPLVNQFIEYYFYILDFMPASQKDIDQFRQIQVEFENGFRQLPGRATLEDINTYGREFGHHLNRVNGRGTRWRFYEKQEIRQFGLAGLDADARPVLMELANSYVNKYAVLYDQALTVFQAVATQYNRVQVFQAACERMTAYSGVTENDLPPERVRGYRGWPPFYWVAGPIAIVQYAKKRLKTMSDLLIEVRELLELYQ